MCLTNGIMMTMVSVTDYSCDYTRDRRVIIDEYGSADDNDDAESDEN